MSAQLAPPNELRPIKISRQIADDLRGKVRAGQYTPGEALPSRRQLAKHFGVAVGTVQQAVAHLVDEGILVARSTSRTEVARNEPLQDSNTDQIRHEIKAAVGIACDLKPLEHPAANVWRHAIVSAMERELGVIRRGAHFLNQYKYADKWPNCADAAMELMRQGYQDIVLVLPDTRHSVPALIRWSRTAEARNSRTIVVCDRPLPYPLWSVYWDSASVGSEAAAHLLDIGCESLIYFSPASIDWVQSRCDSAREMAVAMDLPTANFAIHIGSGQMPLGKDDQIAAAYDAARDMAELPLGRVGVIAANDHIALGLVTAWRERGLEPGRDYAIVAADDTVEARENDLTTFSVPLDSLGREAARLASSKGGSDGPKSFGFEPHLFVRRSSIFDGTYDGVTGREL
ncbi:MAG TPA: GntR family transcriptional regulator [Capsulimonadaceae bacterium]|jgi:DNA-binding LacI/PurR family transcriptional regulator/DNA-binding transcriptional regulator YhcF (GntR family)